MTPRIPVLNAPQAAEWDARARTEARIPSRVLMEAAGRAVAQLAAVRDDRGLAGLVKRS